MFETRDDDYLIAPGMPGLSIKIRGGASFDVKQHRGAVGALDVPDGGGGRIDSWLKLSFPLTGVSAFAPAEVGMAAGEQRAGWSPGPERSAGGSPRLAVCSVELTEVQALGETLVDARIRGRVAGVRSGASNAPPPSSFAEPLPTTRAFEAEEACSYAEWINELGDPGGRDEQAQVAGARSSKHQRRRRG